MMCMMYKSYGIGCADIVLLYIYLYTYIWRKGPVWHGRSAKTVLYIILGGRDLYGTGGVRRRCYDIHIIVSLQMIENECLCVIQMCVCVCV